MLRRKILIVDDSEEDRFFLQRGLSMELSSWPIVGTATNGAMAVDYLSGKGEFSNREVFPFPEVMFLDLKMPRMSGFEVLRWLQQQEFKNLEVIVLSGSCLDIDMEKAKALGAAHYVVKGDPIATAKALVQLLKD